MQGEPMMGWRNHNDKSRFGADLVRLVTEQGWPESGPVSKWLFGLCIYRLIRIHGWEGPQYHRNQKQLEWIPPCTALVAFADFFVKAFDASFDRNFDVIFRNQNDDFFVFDRVSNTFDVMFAAFRNEYYCF